MRELHFAGPTVSLAARRWEQGALPVLALHGWLDNAGSFGRLAPLLTGCDLVALDFPGHGWSGHRPKGTPHHFVDWVPEVLAAADYLGWDRFVLLGHSMGAGVACLLAGALPERVSDLILIEGIGPWANLPEEAPRTLSKALHYRPSEGRRVYATREEALKRLSARDLRSESVPFLAERALKQIDEGWVFTYAKEVRAPSRARLTEHQVRAFLRAVECPTLIVQGTRGLEMPAHMKGRETELRHSSLVTLEGGHHLHLDDPEPVAQAILGHLSHQDRPR